MPRGANFQPEVAGRMVIKIVGALIALGSLYLHIFHLARRGEEPHTFWALLAGIVLMFGPLVRAPRTREKEVVKEGVELRVQRNHCKAENMRGHRFKFELRWRDPAIQPWLLPSD
jgi:hypothetical protein